MELHFKLDKLLSVLQYSKGKRAVTSVVTRQIFFVVYWFYMCIFISSSIILILTFYEVPLHCVSKNVWRNVCQPEAAIAALNVWDSIVTTLLHAWLVLGQDSTVQMECSSQYSCNCREVRVARVCELR